MKAELFFMRKIGADVTVNELVNSLWINVDMQFGLVGGWGGGNQRVDGQCLHLQLFDSGAAVDL